jgi:hypothetical protein
MDEGDRTDEWTTVKRRSSSRNAPQSRIGSKISISEEQMRKQQRKNAKAVSGIVDSCCKIDSDFDLDSTHKEIVNDLIPKLQESAFLRCCLSHLRSYSYNRIVAFGIGRCNNSSSKLQTAFLCCLVKNLLDRSPELASANSSGICTVIDPIYSEKDEALCAMLGLTVERTNTKGKLSLEKTAIRTLYFMPHCPYRLYCNVVWSHRNHPDQPIILGNRYTTIPYPWPPYPDANLHSDELVLIVCVVSIPTIFGGSVGKMPRMC